MVDGFFNVPPPPPLLHLLVFTSIPYFCIYHRNLSNKNKPDLKLKRIGFKFSCFVFTDVKCAVEKDIFSF